MRKFFILNDNNGNQQYWVDPSKITAVSHKKIQDDLNGEYEKTIIQIDGLTIETEEDYMYIIKLLKGELDDNSSFESKY